MNNMEKKHGLSLDDFKKWIKHQPEQESKLQRPVNKLIGVAVESKINVERLKAKIVAQKGEVDQLAIDFEQNGGAILEVDNEEFLIEVDSGQFKIRRAYVKRS